MRSSAPLLLLLLGSACAGASEPRADRADTAHSAFDAASGVRRADRAAPADAPRFVLLGELTGDAEVVYGDPERPGEPFVMRIRELPGTRIPLHSHPVDEHLTVLEGTFYLAVGERWDAAGLKELKAGSYAFVPRGSTMYGASPDGAVVQVHGVGPFEIRWHGGLATLDDSAAARTFRFRKGQSVRAPRGTGTVRQGYASGDIVQYEIQGADGALFMADEADIRPG